MVRCGEWPGARCHLPGDRLLDLREHVERDGHRRNLGGDGGALRSSASGRGAQLDGVRRGEQQEAGDGEHCAKWMRRQ